MIIRNMNESESIEQSISSPPELAFNLQLLISDTLSLDLLFVYFTVTVFASILERKILQLLQRLGEPRAPL